MSQTFEAMLLIEPGEERAVQALNRLLHDADVERHQRFGPIEMDGAGGTKYWTTEGDHLTDEPRSLSAVTVEQLREERGKNGR